jgi:hypothetical protein
MQKMSPISIPMWLKGMLPVFFVSKMPASGNSNPNNGKQKNILNIINFSIIINI